MFLHALYCAYKLRLQVYNCAAESNVTLGTVWQSLPLIIINSSANKLVQAHQQLNSGVLS